MRLVTYDELLEMDEGSIFCRDEPGSRARCEGLYVKCETIRDERGRKIDFMYQDGLPISGKARMHPAVCERRHHWQYSGYEKFWVLDPEDINHMRWLLFEQYREA